MARRVLVLSDVRSDEAEAKLRRGFRRALLFIQRRVVAAAAESATVLVAAAGDPVPQDDDDREWGVLLPLSATTVAVNPAAVYDPAWWSAAYVQHVRRPLRAFYADAADAGAGFLSVDIDDDPELADGWEGLDDEAENRWAAGLGEFVTGQVRTAAEQGGTVAELAAGLRDSEDGWFNAGRAGLLASVAVAATWNRATQATADSARRQGRSSQKVWVTAGDERVRAEHVDMDGVTVDGADEFVVDGAYPAAGPHDPRLPDYLLINCRCSLEWSDAGDADVETITVDDSLTAAALPALLGRFYSEDQPRAEDGRWGEGGGGKEVDGGGASAAPAASDAAGMAATSDSLRADMIVARDAYTAASTNEDLYSNDSAVAEAARAEQERAGQEFKAARDTYNGHLGSLSNQDLAAMIDFEQGRGADSDGQAVYEYQQQIQQNNIAAAPPPPPPAPDREHLKESDRAYLDVVKSYGQYDRDTLSAIQDYQGNGYAQINGNLSAGTKVSEWARPTVEGLDRSMMSPAEPVVVYRGMVETQHLKVGESYKAGAYQSTTTDPVQAMEYSKSSGGVMGAVRTDQSYPVLRVTVGTDAKMLPVPQTVEREVILGRGQTYTVTGRGTVDTPDGKIEVIDVSVG